MGHKVRIVTIVALCGALVSVTSAAGAQHRTQTGATQQRTKAGAGESRLKSQTKATTLGTAGAKTTSKTNTGAHALSEAQATEARIKTSGRITSRVNATTHAAVVRAVNQAFNKLSIRQKKQLGKELWGLYQAIEDDAPAPHVTPMPKDPPPKKPCHNCGDWQSAGSDPCKGLRDELKELSNKAILLGLVGNVLTKLRADLANLAFASGVASLIADVVSTTVTVATGGTSGSVPRAAAQALRGMAVDAVQAAIIDAIAGSLPPPLDSAVSGELTGAALDALIAANQAAIVAANKAKNDKMAEYQTCSKNYTKKQADVKKANEAVEACRKANPTYCL